MNMHWLEVVITLKPPLLSNRSGALPFGLDSAMTLDPHGRPAVPGSLIRGHLRENWDFVDYKDRHKWLGKPASPDSGAATDIQRGAMRFCPWWYSTDKTARQLRYRVRHDSDTDAAAGQMLQIAEVLETENNTPILLKGAIYCLEKPDGPTIEAIRKGLLLTAAIGSNKGIGFGEVLDVTVSEIDPPQALVQARQETDDHFRQKIKKTRELGLSIRPLWPFCFPEDHNPSSNRLVSTETIPGSAIKAVMASIAGPDRLKGFKALFDGMSVTHALPVAGDVTCRPLYPPLSLAIARGRLYDLAHCPGAGLISGEAPAYQPDWKDEQRQAVLERLGWPTSRRLISVHNRHSSDSRAAKNEQLFSREDILPEDGQRWLCNIRMPADVEDDQVDAFIDLLQEIVRQQNFGPLGKTGTPAMVRLHSRSWNFSRLQSSLQERNRVVICLQSPARLLNTQEIREIPATGGGKELQQCYAQAWADLSKNSLELRHYYVLHRFKGGAYWWERYGRNTMERYETQVFTDAGSVFVLDIVDRENAETCLEEWRRLGLPQREGFSNDYEDNPWIRENGWGEITVDASIHREWAVPEREWEEIPLYGEAQ